MQVCLKHPDDLDTTDIGAWRTLCAGHERHDNPFFAPEFAQAVGRVRGDARVLFVGDEAGALKLVVPMQVAKSGLARPPGAPMCDVNGPIGAVEDHGQLAQALARAGIATYAFTGWPMAQSGEGVKVRQREGSAVADLRRGFGAWLEMQRDLHPKHFKKMRRLARQGEKDYGPETVSFGPADAGELATLIAWKREQFARTRRHDVFGATWTRELLKICASESGQGFAGVMAVLRYGGKIAAAEFGLRSGTTLHGWIAGYDPAFASCSPGLVLQERLLEHAAESGVKVAVLGTGEDHYKKHYASYYEAVGDGIVTAAGFSGGARGLAAGVLHALEQGRFGAASRLMGRTRRRLDVILAVETTVGGQLRGVRRALGEDRAFGRTSAAVKAAVRTAAF